MGNYKMTCKNGDQGLTGAGARASNLDGESRKVFQEAATAKGQLYGNECLEHLGREENPLSRENPERREWEAFDELEEIQAGWMVEGSLHWEQS